MAINKLKNKIKDMASGEFLGETEAPEKDSLQESPLKREPEKKETPKNMKSKVASIFKKDSKPNKPTEEKLLRRAKRAEEYNENKLKASSQKSEDSDSPKKSRELNVVEGSVEGYKNVLEVLGIKEDLGLEVLFTSDDLDYIQFNRSAPVGFDMQEVTDFISRVKYVLNVYEKGLKQRNKDIVYLASENKKIEKKMMERYQEEELARVLGEKTEQEELIEENVDLKIMVSNLKNELKEVRSGQSGSNRVQDELDALRAENEYLRTEETREQKEKGKKAEPKEKGFQGLPPLDEVDNNKKDSFDEMLDGLGGLYNEE